MSHCLLVADIGGTNARFALADADKVGFSEKMAFDCEDYASADLAIDAYVEAVGSKIPEVVCIAAAGPVSDGKIQFTNSSWSVDSAVLARRFPGARILLLNDFDAVAWSIPLLAGSDLVAVGEATPLALDDRDFCVGVIGPGTGLGVAGLCKRNGQAFAIGGEGGHVGFSPETALQAELLAEMSKTFDRVPVEAVVSGPGIANVYEALARIRGVGSGRPAAADIFASAVDGTDEIAVLAVQVFFDVLGQAAGDLVLSLGARDGIYVAGGIVRRYPELVADSGFRSGFEAKGPYRTMMESIPTQLVTHPEPGLLGASYCAMQLLRGEM
jgi:glucokinase